MRTTEFGELISIKDECPVGIVLREDTEGVILEKYYDTEWKNCDVLHTFEKGVTLVDKACFYEALKTAREYEPDFDIPIHIKQFLNIPQEETKEQEEKKKTCLECVIKQIGPQPWKSLDVKLCEKCDARKKSIKEHT